MGEDLGGQRAPGDARYLDALFRRYSASVYRRAHKFLGDKDAAKDVTQDVFLRAMNARTELSRLQSPLSWLHRVATNLCLNRLRDSARRKRILNAFPPVPSAPSNDVPLDTNLTVRALLREVPDELRDIAILYFVDRLSQDQISLMLRIPRRIVSSRLEQFRSSALSGTLRWERAAS